MKLKVKLSDLVEVSRMTEDQEGMLRGGFAMLTDPYECKHTAKNGNCSCNTNTMGCVGNGNCSCNGDCQHNCDCNCNCEPTETPTEPTKATDGASSAAMGMGFFMF